MLTAKPKINLQLSPSDKVLESMGVLLVAAMWTYLVYNFSSLPDTIPIHFNGKGEVNGQGTRAMLVSLPLIATVLFIGLTYLNRYPHLFNYPSSFTPENAQQHYIIATRFMRILKIVIVLVFFIILWKTVNIAAGKATNIGVGFLPLVLGLVFIPTIIYLIVAFRKK